MGITKSIIHVPENITGQTDNLDDNRRLVILLGNSYQGLNSEQVRYLKNILESWLDCKCNYIN